MKAGAVVLALVAALSCSGGTVAGGLTAEPAAQAEIGGLITTIAAANRGGTTDGVPARADALLESLGGDREALLQQILLYRAAHGGNEPAMAGALLLDYYGFTNPEKIAALTPHLDTEVPGLREVLWDVLSTVDRPSGTAPNFGVYEQLLGERADDLAGLVRYMYAVAPFDALSALARARSDTDAAAEAIQRARQLEQFREQWATGQAADPEAARRELDALSRDPAWWVRLYAAHVVRARPDLGSEEAVARLRSDPLELIREAAGG